MTDLQIYKIGSGLCLQRPFATYLINDYFSRMKIGFDAKRVYNNGTGLGFFSRVLVEKLGQLHPENDYYLYTPKRGPYYANTLTNLHERLPKKIFDKLFPGLWRSRNMTRDLMRDGIDLFHGLSHEIPFGMPDTHIPAVVTIHDLFPLRYPKEYKYVDRTIYNAKMQYACRYSARVMATSEETKKDIIHFYKTNPEKIEVIYQSCEDGFRMHYSTGEKERVREKYGLPPEFFLHVGTIIERKNLLNICKAIHINKKDVNIPIVVIGRGGSYKEKVKQYLSAKGLEKDVILLADQLEADGKNPFVATADLPLIYKLSKALIYPSYYEGFGIPVLEGISAGVPVITSHTSCLPEIGGDAAYYVDPASAEEIASGMSKLVDDQILRQAMISKGKEHAEKFSPTVYTNHLLRFYQSVL